MAMLNNQMVISIITNVGITTINHPSNHHKYSRWDVYHSRMSGLLLFYPHCWNSLDWQIDVREKNAGTTRGFDMFWPSNTGFPFNQFNRRGNLHASIFHGIREPRPSNVRQAPNRFKTLGCKEWSCGYCRYTSIIIIPNSQYMWGINARISNG